jgi:endoglycosylceramidase
VLIDIHQDDYSKFIGNDGAPLWAIQPPPTQITDGPASPNPLSQEVVSAYGTFFGDPNVGAYLRTRFATMAAELAARFADDPAVIAFETYNEPLATDAQLLAFNQQVIAAIRAAAPNKLVFYEPSATFDEIGEASLGNGSLGAGTAYSPHVYTLAFTDPDTSGVTENTYAPANYNALEEAQSWQAPLVITEFGYPPASVNFVDWALWQGQLQDQVLASSFFWDWKDWGTWGFFDFDDAGTPTERAYVVAAMTRPRLEAAAGQLTSVSYDPTLQALSVTFNGSAAVTAPNVVSIGAGATVPAAQWMATCDGKSVATGGADPLSIPCAGPGGHLLVVSAK